MNLTQLEKGLSVGLYRFITGDIDLVYQTVDYVPGVGPQNAVCTTQTFKGRVTGYSVYERGSLGLPLTAYKLILVDCLGIDFDCLKCITPQCEPFLGRNFTPYRSSDSYFVQADATDSIYQIAVVETC